MWWFSAISEMFCDDALEILIFRPCTKAFESLDLMMVPMSILVKSPGDMILTQLWETWS